MLKKHLFNLLIAMALAITLAFTVREAFATAQLTAEETTAIACASLPSRYSIHTEYIKEADMWVIRTEEGPTGVDGGLSELLAAYQTCAR
jgi:hypothetical protein